MARKVIAMSHWYYELVLTFKPVASFGHLFHPCVGIITHIQTHVPRMDIPHIPLRLLLAVA